MSVRQDVTVSYQGHTVACQQGESLLDAMLRSGIEVDFSCKSGMCHRCMVRCIDGTFPAHASMKLPKHQQDSQCLLLCQCYPKSPIMIAPKSPEDNLTRGVAIDLQQQESGVWRLELDTLRMLDYRTGQLLILMNSDMQQAVIASIVSTPENDVSMLVEIPQDTSLPDWLNPAVVGIAGLEFVLRGPLPVEPQEPVQPLLPDPSLWQQLGGDQKVRAVLSSFYQKLYADAALSPFFERVSMERIIGKQFAFLKENIGGEAVFLGEQPKNAHNWMVINDSLFDHRQGLMLQAMREHAVPEALIMRWSQYEEQFRPDIVKYRPWPKRFGSIEVHTEQYEVCMLEEATVCDYCGAEIDAGTRVKFHRRIARLGCRHCSSVVTGC